MNEIKRTIKGEKFNHLFQNFVYTQTHAFITQTNFGHFYFIRQLLMSLYLMNDFMEELKLRFLIKSLQWFI